MIELAYSTRTGSKNIDILIKGLELQQESGASTVFENDNLFVLSPSVQNPGGRFDVNLTNIEKARANKKKSLLVIRYFKKLLVGNLDKFINEMTIESSMYTHNETRKWQYTVRENKGRYFLTLQKARGIEFDLVKKSEEELIGKYGDPEEKDDYLTTSDLKGSDLTTHVHAYIQSKGFNYSLANIKNLYLSIRSKPFVIISGISGTGKTKIVQLFAESIGATEENNQFKLIPVRPDWSDGSELLGYRDIKGDFIKGPLTEMIQRAVEQPNLPHFVLLDEMNLARVEYYFSDILSVLESRRRDGENIITSYLIDEKIDGQRLRLPENLIIIGTVNMDETTHPFSKKVLDRANTIEFNEINLDSFLHLTIQEEVDAKKIAHEYIATDYISLKDVYETHDQLIVRVSEKLVEINVLLEPMNAHVGYRVRDEICFYMIHSQELDLFTEEEAFDFCIMQKVLPRITGGDDRVEVLLSDLFEWLTNTQFNSEIDYSLSKYPRSAGKVAEMLRGYYANGFTSYWIS